MLSSLKYLVLACVCLISPLAVAQDEPLDVFIVVNLSDDMKYRAENIPETAKDNWGAFGEGTGFLENGNYGVKELEDLSDNLRKRLKRKLEKSGMNVYFHTDVIPDYVLNVLIVDAKTNLPTNTQFSKSAKLSGGLRTGGATLFAKLSMPTDAENYKTYSLRQYGKSRVLETWSDAEMAFDKFAKKVSKDMSKKSIKLNNKNTEF